ncbi:MAG: polysaccharide pyruvyl transferase family protein [Candidatus Aenigmarchaeota archaeon]|nr:polysaccharide pyruvyl transferase family protein [Candidatus Aenigmarchaeota archaeon]
MGKKIGILTYHRPLNYGAALQAYALQEKVKELGAKCAIIDYRNNILENRNRKLTLFTCKTIKELMLYILRGRSYNRKLKNFRGFGEKYFNLSSTCSTKEEVKGISSDFDKFICGSDQVWNHKINGFDEVYYLNFLENPEKKNSYAASFGFKQIPEEYKSRFYSLLKDYNKLSVREHQGAKIIEQLLGYSPQVVLDPTMLLTKEKWFEIIKPYEHNKKYILVYCFSHEDKVISLAKKIAKKTGYDVISILKPYTPHLGVKYEVELAPDEFLGLFKGAEYVVTNSFHGTAFSILFNKQFFTEFLPEQLGVNSRLEDILEIFGLKSRIITNDDPAVIENKINYDPVNRILEKEREKSTNFLKQIVESGS